MEGADSGDFRGRRRESSQWSLTPEAFDRLLTLLDVEREVAAAKYRGLLTKLRFFFEAKGFSNSDELSDAVMDRVARVLEDGTPVAPENSLRFVYGVARNIAREEFKRRSPLATQPLTWDAPEWRAPMPRPEAECVGRCLEFMKPHARELLLNYYEGEGSGKLANRRRLAAELGISHGALVSRVFQLRVQLEKCVRRCLKEE